MTLGESCWVPELLKALSPAGWSRQPLRISHFAREYNPISFRYLGHTGIEAEREGLFLYLDYLILGDHSSSRKLFLFTIEMHLVPGDDWQQSRAYNFGHTHFQLHFCPIATVLNNYQPDIMVFLKFAFVFH
jgi:hypothetical protein